MFLTIVGYLMLVVAALIIIFAVTYTHKLLTLKKVNQSVKHLNSGIMIEQGGVFDRETGEVTPQKRPSVHAFRHRFE